FHPLKEKNMSNLKSLVLAFALVSVLAVPAFAGEMDSPPSAPGEMNSPPCAPGETSTPPCSSASVSSNDSVAPGEVDSPPSLDSVDLIGIAGALRSLLF